MHYLAIILFCLISSACGCDTEKESDPVLLAYLDVFNGNTGFYEYKYEYKYEFSDTEELYIPQPEPVSFGDLLESYHSQIMYNSQKQMMFAVLDMDGDGVREVVTELYLYGDRLIFRYHGGNVYGYLAPYRGMLSLKEDGVYYSSGGAGHNYYKKLHFFGDVCRETTLAYSDWYDRGDKPWDVYYIGGIVVSRDDYMLYGDKHNEKEDAEWCVFSPENFENDLIKAWGDSNGR